MQDIRAEEHHDRGSEGRTQTGTDMVPICELDSWGKAGRGERPPRYQKSNDIKKPEETRKKEPPRYQNSNSIDGHKDE